MPDSQWYPLNDFLINNLEDKVGFQLANVTILAISYTSLAAEIPKSI